MMQFLDSLIVLINFNFTQIQTALFLKYIKNIFELKKYVKVFIKF